MPTVIRVEHLSKTYRLGQISTGTLAHDLESVMGEEAQWF